jgi:hypothetical protein
MNAITISILKFMSPCGLSCSPVRADPAIHYLI